MCDKLKPKIFDIHLVQKRLKNISAEQRDKRHFFSITVLLVEHRDMCVIKWIRKYKMYLIISKNGLGLDLGIILLGKISITKRPTSTQNTRHYYYYRVIAAHIVILCSI
jgi:hypothetical protein